MMESWDKLPYNVTATIVFSAVGLAFFGLVFWMISKLFHVHKEIEEDQNIALAIVIGSVIVGISIIVAAAIH
jgi:putative membrane protein